MIFNNKEEKTQIKYGLLIFSTVQKKEAVYGCETHALTLCRHVCSAACAWWGPFFIKIWIGYPVGIPLLISFLVRSSVIFLVKFVCRVSVFLSARVFSPPPRSPCCLSFLAVSLVGFHTLPTSSWRIPLCCQLSLVNDSDRVAVRGWRWCLWRRF